MKQSTETFLRYTPIAQTHLVSERMDSAEWNPVRKGWGSVT